jgi:single-stranded-DNA-specific exonuclease
MLTEDAAEAKELAAALDQENSNRQRIQEAIFRQAVSKIEGEFNFKDNRVIVVWDEGWHPGVIGIVASKIADRFYRPAVVLSVQDGMAKGSGRSIEKFHLFDAVYQCRDLLEDFGGHGAACGLTVLSDNIEAFRDSINRVARGMISPADLTPKIDVDMELELSSLDERLMGELDMLSPFGAGNPQPLFLSKGLKVKGPPAQYGRTGMKMWVSDKKVTCEAVCFNAADTIGGAEGLSHVDMVYYPTSRHIAGISTLKLEVEDLKPS